MRYLLPVAALLMIAPYGQAGSIQKYVDESGRVVFTNLGTDRSAVTGQRGAKALAALKASVVSREDLYLPFIEESANRHGVSPELVKAVIRVESNFDPEAVSHKGCKGLMQLLPDTAQRFGVNDILDPAQNIEGGVKYLRFLLDLFKNDLSLALAGYNAGENAVARYNGIPPYRETRDYVKKVTALYTPEGSGLDQLAEAPSRINRKIYRIVQADGRVLFTNTPTQAVMD